VIKIAEPGISVGLEDPGKKSNGRWFKYRGRKFGDDNLTVTGSEIGYEDLVCTGVKGTTAVADTSGVRSPPSPPL
jgi:hypothetical protein